MEIVETYFPSLNTHQKLLFDRLPALYNEWNAKINVISRKDIGHLAERHILHSLGIAKVVRFTKNSRILDVGTGGGFPGIPLAILFPEVQFHLIDSIAKKISVVSTIASILNLKNVTTEQIRAEKMNGRYDFIVSRAVAPLSEFISWTSHLISRGNNNSIPNGILYLKGGDLKHELALLKMNYKVIELSDYFDGEFFLTKKIVHIY